MQQGSAMKSGALSHAGEVTSGILSALLYFDIFSYPLTREELAKLCHYKKAGAAEVGEELDRLVATGAVKRADDFYFVGPDAGIVQRRLSGNNLAVKYLSRAGRISSFIACFPFVRAVMISGSLSKRYMDTHSDIDYFIITAKGRLWLCRSLLAAFRKMLPGSLKKYFCINYFIDDSALEIPDKNIFTATEILFVYPTYSKQLYDDFIRANSWIREYYPNQQAMQTTERNSGLLEWPKKLAELIMSGGTGDKLDSALFRFMLKRWKKRYEHFDENDFNLHIRTRKNISKQHEKAHQHFILDKYLEKVAQFEDQHGLKLTVWPRS